MQKLKHILAITALALATTAQADLTIPVNFTSETGVGEAAGTITITETAYGLLFTPNLHGLAAGAHGFHVHANPSCDKNGMAAGSHLDAQNTNKHLGPYNDNGHNGDLPLMYANADGTTTTPLLAPRLHHIADIEHRAIMIHSNGDNYSDTPEKLGGGGARMACGVIT